MERCNINDKILFYVYFFDKDGYDKYSQMSGVILEILDGYGYKVKISQTYYFSMEEITESNVSFDDTDATIISVTYKEVIESISHENSDTWKVLDIVKNRWRNLSFRYVTINTDLMVTSTYKKGNMGDTYGNDIDIDYQENYIFSTSSCWFLEGLDVLPKKMIVGIVDSSNPKSFKTWAFCDERLYQLWWILCKTNGKEYYEKSNFIRENDIYKDIADYIINDTLGDNLPIDFQTKFKKSMLWFN